MKVRTRSATGGIREQHGQLIFDFSLDRAEDFLSLTSNQLYGESFLGNVYRFGYEFCEDVSSKDRSKVIHFIKGLSEQKPSQKDLHKFIEKPLVLLDNEINLTTIDCVVCPQSKRSTLVQQMVEQVGDFLRHDVPPVFFELVKSLPEAVAIDWDRFCSDVPLTADKQEKNRHIQMVNQVMRILQNIKSRDYFSIAETVPTKYRRYIKNYLQFESSEHEKAFKALQNKRVLVVDDINTSGATLKEIIRIIKQVNNISQIYVFTLIGRE